ncbi:MAG: DUF6404 family protein [Bacteroidota bacterium]
MQNFSAFERKYAKAREELENKMNWRPNYIYRLTEKFWKQLKFRPPYYKSFVSDFAVFTLSFVLAFLLYGWVIAPLIGATSSMTMKLLMLVGAILMGLWVALATRYTAQKHNLSKWRDL